MDLHGEIMNIQIDPTNIIRAIKETMKYDKDIYDRLELAYKMGHRDARHVAAELSLTHKN